VEIRIGIVNTPRELNFETNDTAEAVQAAVAKALEERTTHLTFTDAKGNTMIVPTVSLAYIELGAEESRRIGFVV
jgi:hypothetical protein